MGLYGLPSWAARVERHSHEPLCVNMIGGEGGERHTHGPQWCKTQSLMLGGEGGETHPGPKAEINKVAHATFPALFGYGLLSATTASPEETNAPDEALRQFDICLVDGVLGVAHLRQLGESHDGAGGLALVHVGAALQCGQDGRHGPLAAVRLKRGFEPDAEVVANDLIGVVDGDGAHRAR